jgi:hypothetical protein
MKFLVFKLILLFTITTVIQAENRPPSDAAALTAVLSTAVRKFLEPHNHFPGKTVSLKFSPPYTPSKSSRQAVEVVLTGFGYAITDNAHKADFSLDIAITDARVIIQPDNNGFSRTVLMQAHFKYLDSSRMVILASGHEEMYEDELSRQFLRQTDDSNHFCNNSMRITIEKYRGRVRLISFIILTGILVYFASQ